MLDKDQFISKLKEKLKVVNSITENNDLVDFSISWRWLIVYLCISILDTDKNFNMVRLVSISAIRVVFTQEAKDKAVGSNTEAKLNLFL